MGKYSKVTVDHRQLKRMLCDIQVLQSIGDFWQLQEVLFCALMEGERENLPVLGKNWQVNEQHKRCHCANKLLSSEY